MEFLAILLTFCLACLIAAIVMQDKGQQLREDHRAVMNAIFQEDSARSEIEHNIAHATMSAEDYNKWFISKMNPSPEQKEADHQAFLQRYEALAGRPYIDAEWRRR